jgi:ribose transport system ATP-binding protein
MTDAPAMEMVDITKTFPGVVALSGVSFDCRYGEVHAICGENGAGKSTLMNVLGGNYRPDSGEVRIDGRPVRFGHPQEARAAGVSVVHQELSLLPFRSVAENVFLGVEPTRRGLLDRSFMRRRTAELLARIGGDIDPDMPVASLSIAAQQTVEIAKALLLDAHILVLDEPTAALDEREAKALLALVAGLRSQGIAIVYISHKMPELMALPDRITVLKDGQKVWTHDRKDADLGTIVSAMVGRDLKDFYPHPPQQPPGNVLLTVEGGSNAELDGVDLTLRAGEIVGIGGLEDSGKTALAQAIFGDKPFSSGTIRIDGRPHTIASPRQAITAGIGYLPGDRKREGLAIGQSVRDNALLTLHANEPLLSVPDRGRLGPAATDQRLSTMDVRASDYAQPVGALSGGNQQKVILCRWLAQQCRILVFVEPTRGVDIAAKAAVYEAMREFADAGNAILVISSELPELIGISDRLLAMHQGRIVGELPRGASEEEVMRLSVGLGQQEQAQAAPEQTA